MNDSKSITTINSSLFFQLVHKNIVGTLRAICSRTMNYFSVRSLSCLGLRVIDVEIECVQSRRLPFLQIIGASSAAAGEQRERISAAIESSGFRMPKKRLTVRYHPDLHGLPLENFDCGVALAILGSAGAYPRTENSPILVSGSLTLEGKLRAIDAESTAWGDWLRSNRGENMIVPRNFPNFPGDGGLLRFGDLKSIVQYFRDGTIPAAELEAAQWMACKNPAPIEAISPSEERILSIAAAGLHHLLAFTGKGARGELLARHLQYYLNETRQSAAPLRSVLESQMARLFRYDSKSGAWGDLSLAHGGVLFLQKFGHRNPSGRAERILWEAMREGGVRGFRAGHAAVAPAEVLVLAEAADCECGETARAHCRCRPAMRESFRSKVASAPFDLKLIVRLEGAPTTSSVSHACLSEKIKAARRRMLLRGKVNSRLSLAAAMGAIPWEEEAKAWLRVGERRLGMEETLARVALTICDLRQGAQISKADLFEAWHHVAGVEFADPISGAKREIPSMPSENCTAIP